MNKKQTILFGDLYLSSDLSYAYQKDPQPFDYGQEYWQRYNDLENTEISKKLNQFRCDFVEKYVDSLLDVGIGSGAFIKQTKAKAYGFDINPFAVEYLKKNNLFFDPYENKILPFSGWTFWDCIEHMKNPESILCKVKKGQFVFLSIPIFSDLTKVKQSKHYKPNEHVLYFTSAGLIKYMNKMDFVCIEISDEETVVGRDNILSFAFKKQL